MGCKCDNSKRECYIPLTIERQLRTYAECPDHIERHEILWHEWNHNKRWLIQVQQLILPSFPSYSRHDVSHSEAVLHNIEMILGEENIKELSPTDCFVLLHTVYIHDIGMCITHGEKEEILKNGKFHDYLEKLIEGGNTDMSHYAEILLRECFKKDSSKSGKQNTKEDRQYILDEKLEVYYAITYLISEFRRKEHGEVSQKRLEEWIDNPDKLGIGFSTIEIPDRLFYVIAHCAAVHTKWEFKEVLDLHQEDSGFVRDYVHPRFIAVLLQLGDALDMDNDRFHPLTKEYLGKLPEMSKIHYNKHKAIRRLRINNQKISISADCKTQSELRVIRSECDGIQDILKNATFYWAVIKPVKSNMCLPTIDKTELLLDGKPIPAELVKAQFEISQEKAFELLKGNNIYTEEHFVFLRELIQNAVDATKIQYFRDYKRCLKRMDEKDKVTFSNPVTIGKKNDPLRYPIDIELSMKKCKDSICENISEEDLKNPEKNLAGYECGVLVKITDYATGISKEDIEQIANVGSSYPSKEKEIKTMPMWLQPTGTFGIGLQSVFLSTKVLKATTHALTGEPYEIVFHPRHEGEAGYINVTPRSVDANTEPFGSCFEVFVPYQKKKTHCENPETWDGMDPFEADYEKTRPIRHTRELMKQMALYIGDMVGEALFPINLIIRDCDNKNEALLYDEVFRKRFMYVTLSLYYKYSEKYEPPKQEEPEPNITWAYNLGKKNKDKIIYVNEEKGDMYRLDCDRAELRIWNQAHSAYACVGIKRILNMRDRYNKPEEKKLDEGIKIFYKGIQVTHTSFEEDANLIEYIDLKQTLKKEYLKLNRKGFSQQGYEYLEVIYHDILQTAREALEYFGTKKTDALSKIKNKIENLLKDSKFEQAEEVILSATALVYFAMLNQKEEFCFSPAREQSFEWNKLLDDIIDITSKDGGEYFEKSTLYNLPMCDETVSIMQIISSSKKYAILSERDEKSRQWMMYLIDITDEHKGIKEKIAQLNSTVEWRQRKELLEKIDEEGNKLIDRALQKNPEEKGMFLKVRKEQKILKWILSNIPTMAIFASEDGNKRMNLLDVDINDCVYYDINMKGLVIERIVASCKSAKRFSVPAWSGYQYLCLQEMRKSVLFINRGKISKMSYKEMVFPFTGQQIEQIMKEIYVQLSEQNDYTKKINELCYKAIVRVLEKISRTDDAKRKALEERYWERANKALCDTTADTGNSLEVYDIADEEYQQVVNWLESGETQNCITWDDKIVPALRQIQTILSQYEEDMGQQKYDCCLKNQIQYNILSEYIQKNGRKKPSANQINSLYHRYVFEIMYVLLKRRYLSKKGVQNIASIKSE